MLARPQTKAPLEDVLARPQLVESLVRILASPPPEEPPQHVLSHLQTEAPLEDVLPPPQRVESLVSVLVSPSPEEPQRLGFLAGRRACSFSASVVTGARACLPSAGAPGASACSPHFPVRTIPGGRFSY